MRRPPRPKPFAVGKIRVRVHSGPREDGRWRWRADRAAGVVADVERREAVWSGWGTRDEAEAAVLAAATDTPTPEGAADIRTVYDLLDVWLADYTERARSPHSSRHRRYCCERLARSELAAVHLQRLDVRALDRYTATPPGRGRRGGGSEDTPIARSTLAEDVTTLRMAWRWGRERGFTPDRDLPRSPVRVEDEDAVYSRYTPGADEVVAVLGYLERWPWAWRALYLLWATGCRRGEVAALRWTDVDLERNVIRLRAGASKTGRRVVPLHPRVVTTIADWPRVTDRVIGVGANTIGALNERIRLACESLHAPRWSCHGLRRAAVDRLYRSGVDPAVAASMFGHSAKTAMEHYRRVTDADLAAAVLTSGLGLMPEPGQVIDLSARLSGRRQEQG